MLGLGALSFATPWALGALAALPVIWWLLKVNPPAPKRISFPAVRLLFGLRRKEETPTKTPPWLIVLRLVLATLAILAVAGPLINSAPRLAGDGPLIVVVDDGWTAAAHWTARLETLEALLDQADRASRPVILATTAPSAAGARPLLGAPMTAADARDAVGALAPKPWAGDRAALTEALDDLKIDKTADVAWLSDGLAGDAEAARALAARLRRFGPLRVHVDGPEDLAMALLPPGQAANDMKLRVLRATPAAGPSVTVRALATDGRLLARQPVAFSAGEPVGEQVLDLPPTLRNEIARLEIEGAASAGAVVLLDERWRRRPVGLISGGGFESSQPLLSDLYYLERALSPYNEVRRGTLSELLDGGLAVLTLADVGRVSGADRDQLETWIAGGGVLVRFAGPRLADGVDELVPVRLRAGGGRALGGALSWTQPMPLADFDEDSPFSGLAVPGDVLVARQVLAEPSPELDERTWARLADGTPLVTAAPRGEGWLVLFHTTANAEWSDLALSGLFVEMMRRVVELSEGVAGGGGTALLPALETLDGFGHLGDPPPDAEPVTAADIAATPAGPRHPPGFYGNSLFRRVLNLSAGIERLAPLDGLPDGTEIVGYDKPSEVDLRPWLLAAMILLALADTVIGLALRGLTPSLRRAGAGAAIALIVAGLVDPAPIRAQDVDEEIALESTRATRLAYVLTHEAEVDSVSLEGLTGLGHILARRTAIEPGPPIGLDPETDELVFYPLLYWPVTETPRRLSDAAMARVDAYLRVGGMILFDTRDQSPIDRLNAGSRPLGGPLREVLRGLNVPPLIKVPPGHALTQSFYLLDRFPGRWDGGSVWVERYEGDVNDGVSSVVIGGNDWAAAWALDDQGYPIYPVVPGGQRQRELAFRFGVNLAMYALTGNYKADQVHIPAILRRLGGAARDEVN